MAGKGDDKDAEENAAEAGQKNWALISDEEGTCEAQDGILSRVTPGDDKSWSGQR